MSDVDMQAVGSDVDDLMRRLSTVGDRVIRAVNARRSDDPAPDDPFRGLYLSDETVAWLIGRPGLPRGPDGTETAWYSSEDQPESTGSSGRKDRLTRLGGDFDLVEVDLELLLVSLLPEIDPRYEQFYGYLNDDVTRRRPCVGLALQLCGQPVSSGPARARLASTSPLVSGGLLAVEDVERPFLGRALRVPDRVVSHLLGIDTPDTEVAEVLAEPPPFVDFPSAGSVAAALGDGARLICVRDSIGGAGRTLAAASLAGAGFQVVPVDLSRLCAVAHPSAAVAAVVREARLTGAGIITEVPSQVNGAMAAALATLSDGRVPVVLVLRSAWDPAWSRMPPLFVEAPVFRTRERVSLWRVALGDVDQEALAATAPFVLSPDGVMSAAETARRQASFEQVTVSAHHVRRGARLRNAAGLERLARRVEPSVSWADLVLPAPVLAQIREIALRTRHRDRVLGEWRMRPGGGRGHGVTALFAGDSGTGKTMSAEVIAADLGLDLYVVDLATVVDKYVGETEKNLERIFTEAVGINGVLLFDEADAVFGKRSEVKDAHDRYANIESAYLLQRMESFDGLAVLATNLRANLDEAFTRRLDIVVDFPNPSEEQRRALWDRCLGDTLPRDDLDLDFCARAFDVTGGSIRSIAVTAAYLAADTEERLTMPLLMDAVQREYRKLGRLVVPSEFDPISRATAR